MDSSPMHGIVVNITAVSLVALLLRAAWMTPDWIAKWLDLIERLRRR